MVIHQKSAGKGNAREALLDAMERLLHRYGYQKTTVEDIAAEAGVGKGSVYLHFASKEELALSCVDRFHDQIWSRMEKIAAGKLSAREKVAALLRERVQRRYEFCENSASLDEMLAALRRELMVRREAYHLKEAQFLEAVILAGVETGEFPICDAARSAEAMVLATNAFLPYSLRVNQLGSLREVLAKLSSLTCLLMDGLAGMRVESPGFEASPI